MGWVVVYVCVTVCCVMMHNMARSAVTCTQPSPAATVCQTAATFLTCPCRLSHFYLPPSHSFLHTPPTYHITTVCRDFTVNALYYDPHTNEVLDFVGGVDDALSRTLRLTHDDTKRLTEDPLRVLRGVRFATVLGLKLAPGTALAMKRYAHMCSPSAGEREGGSRVCCMCVWGRRGGGGGGEGQVHGGRGLCVSQVLCTLYPVTDTTILTSSTSMPPLHSPRTPSTHTAGVPPRRIWLELRKLCKAEAQQPGAWPHALKLSYHLGLLSHMFPWLQQQQQQQRGHGANNSGSSRAGGVLDPFGHGVSTVGSDSSSSSSGGVGGSSEGSSTSVSVGGSSAAKAVLVAERLSKLWRQQQQQQQRQQRPTVDDAGVGEGFIIPLPLLVAATVHPSVEAYAHAEPHVSHVLRVVGGVGRVGWGFFQPRVVFQPEHTYHDCITLCMLPIATHDLLPLPLVLPACVSHTHSCASCSRTLRSMTAYTHS